MPEAEDRVAELGVQEVVMSKGKQWGILVSVKQGLSMDIRTSKHARWGVVGKNGVELTLGGGIVFQKLEVVRWRKHYLTVESL